MHVLFDAEGRPFILDSEMRWHAEPNAFLAHVSLVSGKTSSPATWRSYAYQFADWLSFCDRIGVAWRHATELNIATYRNILLAEASPLTGRTLRRTTVNHKLCVICQFYRFAWKKGWIGAPPFDLEDVLMASTLRIREPAEEVEIPPRRDVRRFIKSFRSWRDQLMSEVMWLTGLRCAEVCTLPLHSLPENPAAIEKETVTVKITGKGRKQRAVLFPVRLLRSIDRYVHMGGRQRVRPGAEAAATVFVGRTGRPLQTAAVHRVFSTNCKRTGLRIWPHLLRHCFAVERLAYLQDIGAPNPLKTVQMELGHAHLTTTERYLHLTGRMRNDIIEVHNSFLDRLLEG
jgi:site-specific recombinase XerD